MGQMNKAYGNSSVAIPHLLGDEVTWLLGEVKCPITVFAVAAGIIGEQGRQYKGSGTFLRRPTCLNLPHFNNAV